MAQDEFTKLFKYMTERFDMLEEKLDSKAETADIRKILNIQDDLSKR